jgi:Glyoxalase-like domain
MPEIDHVFVFCRPGAPEADLLLAAGLRIGRERQHPGQGTASKCFFFANAMLELLWVENETEARSALVQPLALWERSRWRDSGASPYGICFRLEPGEQLPLPTWNYRPPYLRGGMAIQVARGLRPEQELVFAVTSRWDPPDVEHPFRGAMVTGLDGHCPPSEWLRRTERGRPGGGPHLEIELDGGSGARFLDFAPELPLALRW